MYLNVRTYISSTGKMAGVYKPSQLECKLQRLSSFSSPRVELEQYATPAHIAAHLLWSIEEEFGDVRGKVILDLGCGCGTLAIGCLLLGAEKVFGVDIDQTAVDTAQENARMLDLPQESLSLLCCDVQHLSPAVLSGTAFDVVVMNPPFGTKGQRGIDAQFVQKALSLAGTVYSLHKTSTRDFWQKKGLEWGAPVRPVTQVHWNLDKTLNFHRKHSKDISVDLLRFRKLENLGH